MECRKCHGEIPDGSKFCMLCGAEQNPPPKRKALKRANGTGTVFKLSGHRKRPWVAQRKKVTIGYYETKTAALEALNKLSGQDISDSYNMTFSEVFTEWKEEHFKSISKSSKDGYERAYALSKDLHGRKFRELRSKDFQSIIDANNGKSNSSLSKLKVLWTQMSKWALREEIIYTDFAHFVKLPSEQKKERPVFTSEEIKKIEAEGSETARIICMLLSTGMRINELFKLPLEDYHEDYVIGGSKTEEGKNRIIPIRPEGKPHFAYFAAKSAGKKKLLDGYSGNKDIKNFRDRDYKPLLRKLNIDTDKTPHCTRHTYASRAVKEQLRPEYLRKIMGHSAYSTTIEKYTHIPPEDLVKAVSSKTDSQPVTNTLLTNPEFPEKEKP